MQELTELSMVLAFDPPEICWKFNICSQPLGDAAIKAAIVTGEYSMPFKSFKLFHSFTNELIISVLSIEDKVHERLSDLARVLTGHVPACLAKHFLFERIGEC